MDTINWPQFFFASLFVLALIGLFAYGLRRYAEITQRLAPVGKNMRLHIIEMRHLDPKRKLALVRRDGVEHLLLLGEGRETVVESNIPAKEQNPV